MLKRIFIYSLFALFTFSASCKKKEEADPLLLNVTPDLLVFSSHAGEVVQFNVQAGSETGLKKFFVISKIGSSFSKTLMDSTLTGERNFKYTYEYLIPDSTSNYSVILNFRVVDNYGLEKSSARQINVSI